MAYMDQEGKAKLAAELKKVMPAGWKYTLAVRHHSTIVLTISEAPFDIIAGTSHAYDNNSAKINPYCVRGCFTDSCLADTFEQIVAALNTGNHDRSDLMCDLHDVGWYVDVRVGRWNKPFKFVAPAPTTEAAATLGAA